MKKYKLILIIFLLYSINIFAVNFEADLYASAGLQYTIYKRFDKNPIIIYPKTTGFIGGEFGVYGCLGANFDIPNNTLKNISALIDLGYCKTSFSTIAKIIDPFGIEQQHYEITSTFFDTIYLGFLGKLNFNKNFSFGIGAGVMFAFSGFTLWHEGDISRFSIREIKDTYSKAVMPYIKVSFESRKYLTDKLSFIYGCSLFYNFGLKAKMIEESIKMSGIGISIFAGISFGKPQ